MSDRIQIELNIVDNARVIYNDSFNRKKRSNARNRSFESIATSNLLDNQLVIAANARRNIKRQAAKMDSSFFIHLNDESLGIKPQEPE